MATPIYKISLWVVKNIPQVNAVNKGNIFFFHNEKRNIFLHSTIKKNFATKDAKMTFCYFARESTPGISFLFM